MCLNEIRLCSVNSLFLEQNGHRFAENIFKIIFLHANCFILIEISLKSVLISPINNIRQCRSHYFNQLWPSSLIHICFTRPEGIVGVGVGGIN